MREEKGGTRDSGAAVSEGSLKHAIEPMSRAGIGLVTLYLLVLSISSTYTLIKIWPPAAVSLGATSVDSTRPSRDTSARSTAAAAAMIRMAKDDGNPVALFWGKVRLDFGGREELRLLLVALLAGALGAFVSSAMSFASYLGNRRLDRWWAIWYLVRPPVGMVLALIAYFLLRGGLLSPGASVSNVSPYGVAGIAGLMGMFVKEATDNMRDVATALFQSQENERRAAPLTTGDEAQSERTHGAMGVTSPPVHRYDPSA
ncbi:MAG: hypothetical protein ACREJ9_03550 [Candidatus Rokuibacteriota bacterium]